MNNNFDINEAIARFKTSLINNADQSKAQIIKSYLKSPYKFYGVSVPFVSTLAKDFIKTNKGLEDKIIIELCSLLWDSNYHEEKTLAIKILDIIKAQEMELFEKMLSQSKGWDHVDAISIHLVGGALINNSQHLEYLRKWSAHDNFWMRRSSLISQILPFKKGLGDRALFYSFADKMIEEKEFFIRKAIGWTLRELSKIYPKEVFDYLLKVKGRASGLTYREGSKRLPQEYKDRL